MPRPSRFVEGSRHDRLTSLIHVGNGYALYRCDCGATKSIYIGHVLAGKIRSCGCLHREIARTTPQPKHGYFGTRMYAVWNSMKQRCSNPRHRSYKDYGGRGIKVCKRWEKFENFLADMGEPPIGLTLERRHNDKGYSKSNCVWATPKEQGNNRRACVRLTHAGKTLNITQWAAHLGLPRQLLYSRHRLGWDAKRILTEPKRGSV